jgi:peptidyl-prolyl cis-trans isomerase SurA
MGMTHAFTGRLAFAATMACAFAALASPAGAQTAPASATAAATDSGQKPVVLDSVIAVINGDVLLESDLQQELAMATLQPFSLPPGKDLESRAAQRLINRVLILQQMKAQGMAIVIPDAALQKDLDDLRRQLPACAAYHCQTEEGWAKFLADHNLTPSEVETRWRERMQILRFIDARFRAGVRISQVEIKEYYNKTLVPQLEAANSKAPALDSVSGRIEEVLLQQHVNSLLQDWLKSLRDQGNVLILDPALDIGNSDGDAAGEGGEE